jgi:hypothetical protein
MRVMAISITVARTGEMAFLVRIGILKTVLLSYGNVPENGTCPPLERAADPVKAWPEVAAPQPFAAVTGTPVATPVAGIRVAVMEGEHVTPP